MKTLLHIFLATFLLFSSCSTNVNDNINSENIADLTNPNNVAAYKKEKDQGSLYRDLGVYRYDFEDGTYVQLTSYIWKRENNSGYYPQYKYEYVLTSISESYNGIRNAETWLYNNRIFYNSEEISAHQFPYGMTTYIKTEATGIYSWFTNDEDIADFGMAWSNAIYENR